MPRSWAYRHAPDPEFSRVQTPSLQLPLADPVAFLERHEAVLGRNARNVINIAPEVGRQKTSHTNCVSGALCEPSSEHQPWQGDSSGALQDLLGYA